MPVEVQQGLARASAVLAALGDSTTGALRASEIGRIANLGATTIARLLSSLEELEYVSKDPESQLYSIGPQILKLSSQGLNQNAVHRESRSVAQELARRTGLSVNVAIRHGDHIVYLCHFEGELAPKAHTMIGMRQPMHASALGKCLLSEMTDTERRELLGPEPLPSYTAMTLTTHESLTADLESSQASGVFTENQELALGRLCIGAPIHDAHGAVVASISVSGRLSVMRQQDLEDVTELMIEAADRISVGLGMISAIPH
ncbi:IclR family transcriptional regulator [Rhodoglobus sp. NPDC076762]